jgi:hypothetical protein
VMLVLPDGSTAAQRNAMHEKKAGLQRARLKVLAT